MQPVSHLVAAPCRGGGVQFRCRAETRKPTGPGGWSTESWVIQSNTALNCLATVAAAVDRRPGRSRPRQPGRGVRWKHRASRPVTEVPADDVHGGGRETPGPRTTGCNQRRVVRGQTAMSMGRHDRKISGSTPGSPAGTSAGCCRGARAPLLMTSNPTSSASTKMVLSVSSLRTLPWRGLPPVGFSASRAAVAGWTGPSFACDGGGGGRLRPGSLGTGRGGHWPRAPPTADQVQQQGALTLRRGRRSTARWAHAGGHGARADHRTRSRSRSGRVGGQNPRRLPPSGPGPCQRSRAGAAIALSRVLGGWGPAGGRAAGRAQPGRW